MVPPASRRVSRAPRYSGYRYGCRRLRPRGCHPLWPDFPVRQAPRRPPTSRPCNPRAASTARVWALPLPLAATRGVTSLFSSPAATKMFQFAAFASASRRMPSRAGFPIRTPAGLWPLAPRRRVSPLAASFVASRSLGIPHAPSLAFSSPGAGRLAPPGPAASRSECQCACVASLPAPCGAAATVENVGFEPTTPCLQGRRSSQLS